MPEPDDTIYCLQCGESQETIRYSQRNGDPIFCAGVDYFGETEWEAPRHRFRDWSYEELVNMRILPQYHHLYPRVSSTWGIDPAHQSPRMLVLYEE
ncbi:hypothetical protein SEA_ZOOMAN_41 [Microbacterium phage Zooman]|nr:hypothetical protein SEA_ZOOMAN_41 [Microbacterium phage Zooman]